MREIFPSIYKRNLRQEKYVENILLRLERNLPKRDAIEPRREDPVSQSSLQRNPAIAC